MSKLLQTAMTFINVAYSFNKTNYGYYKINYQLIFLISNQYNSLLLNNYSDLTL